jgi:hypothetical protein
LVCWFFVFLLFFGAIKGFQVLGFSGVLRGEDGVCCVFLEGLFGSKFYDLDLRFSLHYCTTPASPLGSSAFSESPDVQRVLHRPLHIGAWHSRARPFPVCDGQAPLSRLPFPSRKAVLRSLLHHFTKPLFGLHLFLVFLIAVFWPSSFVGVFCRLLCSLVRSTSYLLDALILLEFFAL